MTYQIWCQEEAPRGCGCCSDTKEYVYTPQEWVDKVLRGRPFEDRLAMLQDMFGILLEHVVEGSNPPTELLQNLFSAVDPNAQYVEVKE